MVAVNIGNASKTTIMACYSFSQINTNNGKMRLLRKSFVLWSSNINGLVDIEESCKKLGEVNKHTFLTSLAITDISLKLILFENGI